MRQPGPAELTALRPMPRKANGAHDLCACHMATSMLQHCYCASRHMAGGERSVGRIERVEIVALRASKCSVEKVGLCDNDDEEMTKLHVV